MDATITVPVILALMSAMAFVAYKHPKSYRRITEFGSGVVLAGVVGIALVEVLNIYAVATFYSGSDAVALSVERVIEVFGPIEARAARLLWMFLIVFILCAYHALLLHLPGLLSEDKEDHPE